MRKPLPSLEEVTKRKAALFDQAMFNSSESFLSWLSEEVSEDAFYEANELWAATDAHGNLEALKKCAT